MAVSVLMNHTHPDLVSVNVPLFVEHGAPPVYPDTTSVSELGQSVQTVGHTGVQQQASVLGYLPPILMYLEDLIQYLAMGAG